MTTEKSIGFVAGATAMAAVHSLYQDVLGIEAYIASVRAGWVSSAFTIPVALIALSWALHTLFKDPRPI